MYLYGSLPNHQKGLNNATKTKNTSGAKIADTKARLKQQARQADRPKSKQKSTDKNKLASTLIKTLQIIRPF